MALSSVSGGLLSDRLIARGHPPVAVRRSFLVIGLAGTALLLPAVLLPRLGWALGGLFLSCLTFGIYASNLYSLTQTLAGPEAAGRWTGLQNACGNMAGICSTLVTGWLIQKTGSFTFAFLGASISCILGAASFWLFVREEHPDIFSPGIDSNALVSQVAQDFHLHGATHHRLEEQSETS
jgi:nitrate/nitrite transporter NarK